MKSLKKLYIALLTIPALLLSCGSDDNETTEYSIVGKWNTQYVQIHTNLPETSDFDRMINGYYIQRFEKYTVKREYQEITAGNDMGRVIISKLAKQSEALPVDQTETYSIKGDTLYITDASLGGQTIPVYFKVGEDFLLTRHLVVKTTEKDEISPIMRDLGLGQVIADDNPPYGTTGIVTMQFKRIKE